MLLQPVVFLNTILAKIPVTNLAPNSDIRKCIKINMIGDAPDLVLLISVNGKSREKVEQLLSVSLSTRNKLKKCLAIRFKLLF